MADAARKYTDKELVKMERKVDKIYREASEDISKSWTEFMESHKPKLQAAYDALEEAKKSGDQKAINDAKEVYERTAKNILVNDQRYREMLDETTTKLAHTNEVALAYVNDQMPKIYTKNYNQMAVDTEGVKGYSFSMVNEQAVKNLAKTDKMMLPKKKIDIPKDKAWNQKNINSQMLQGILQGESIPKIAKRLMNVTDMNRKSAIRNARTMTTSIENKGRQDSYEKAVEDGIILKRIWVAIHDERTRAWHADLDGVEVDIDEPWENDYGEIMKPGDPTADPCNVYNCRCGMRVDIKGFKWNQKSEEELTLDEEGALIRYKSPDSYVINDILRNEGFSGLSNIQKENVRSLDDALEKLPKYEGNLSRSIQFSNQKDLNDFIADIERRNIWHSPTPLSTTKSKELYNPKAQVQMFIKNSKNGRDLAGFGLDEEEVLYERNFNFNILSKGWEGDTYVIVMEERKKKKR